MSSKLTYDFMSYYFTIYNFTMTTVFQVADALFSVLKVSVESCVNV